MLIWIYQSFFVPAVIAVALVAWWKGQWPERFAGTLFVAALAATKLVKSGANHQYLYIETGILVVDVTLTVALAILAIRSGRGWLIWATAFQLLSTSSHLARMLYPSMTALAYAIMAGIGGYPTIILLAVGIWRNPRPSEPPPGPPSQTRRSRR